MALQMFTYRNIPLLEIFHSFINLILKNILAVVLIPLNWSEKRILNHGAAIWWCLWLLRLKMTDLAHLFQKVAIFKLYFCNCKSKAYKKFFTLSLLFRALANKGYTIGNNVSNLANNRKS